MYSKKIVIFFASLVRVIGKLSFFTDMSGSGRTVMSVSDISIGYFFSEDRFNSFNGMLVGNYL